MNISTFAQKYNTTTSTVRYYIKIGLLIPQMHNKHYVLCQNDEQDMELIVQLKKWNFTLNDISLIMAEKRINKECDSNKYTCFSNIFHKYSQKYTAEIQALEQRIMEMDAALSLLTNPTEAHTHLASYSGVHLSFLPYFSCPNCNKTLTIIPREIKNSQIYEATIHCECGYKATIEDGIFITGFSAATIAKTDADYGWCYKDLAEHEIKSIYKIYHWIADKLLHENTNGKIIIESFINEYCFILNKLENLNKNALYILTDSSLDIIKKCKERIEKIPNPPLVLYIAGNDLQLPITKNCVDYYIDFFKNCCFCTWNTSNIFEDIIPYLNSNASIIGAFTYANPTSNSIRYFKELFPYGYKDNFNLPVFKTALQNHGLKLIESFCDEAMLKSSLPWHIEGDELKHFCYHAKLK